LVFLYGFTCGFDMFRSNQNPVGEPCARAHTVEPVHGAKGFGAFTGILVAANFPKINSPVRPGWDIALFISYALALNNSFSRRARNMYQFGMVHGVIFKLSIGFSSQFMQSG